MESDEQARQFETFETAFRDGVSSCRGQCACGRSFYNPDGSWSWEQGELERLENSPATGLDYAVGFLTFEGTTYVDACDCWHPRARRIVGFLDGHRQKIAAFLNAEADRKLREAEAAPRVM